MWFGSVFKNKGGKVLSSQPLTREGVNYAIKVNKLLASPPKKHPNSSHNPASPSTYNPPKTPTPSTTTKSASNTTQGTSNSWQASKTSETLLQQSLHALAPFCQQVEESFHKQNAVNETFNARVIHLEETTEGMDRKIDQLLEGLLPAARKTPRITENMQCDAAARPSPASNPLPGAQSNHDH
jgi:hypothetical protein